MNPGDIKYQFEAPDHSRGGDPAGGYVIIDTDRDRLKVKSHGSGVTKSIDLADLYAAVNLWRSQERLEGETRR